MHPVNQMRMELPDVGKVATQPTVRRAPKPRSPFQSLLGSRRSCVRVKLGDCRANGSTHLRGSASASPIKTGTPTAKTHLALDFSHPQAADDSVSREFSR